MWLFFALLITTLTFHFQKPNVTVRAFPPYFYVFLFWTPPSGASEWRKRHANGFHGLDFKFFYMWCLQIENLHLQNDEIMNELSKETENGRLVRILVKLGMMNERPDDDMDPGWSETGDRYLLKLFRDFVFHQVLSLSLFGISKKSWLLFGGWGA